MLAENDILQGRYKILSQIGRGGMGAVYKALDMRLNATMALKQTLIEGDVAQRAFEREARLLANLRHPALPVVSDYFSEADGQFLVMQFIPGDDLATLLNRRGHPFPLNDVVRWAERLCDALDYLHSQNPPVIHRDIKPQNMKLTDRDEIILLDFGLAKSTTSQATRVTSTGSIYGYTPHYAPLEQIKGSGTAAYSDIYALCATLYNLLTAAPPPDALTRAAARINEEPDPLRPANELNPEVSPAVASILMWGMAQKPDQRPASAKELARALRDAERNPTGSFQTVVLPDSSAGIPTIAGGGGATTITPVATQTNQTKTLPTTTTQPGTAPTRNPWLLPVIVSVVLIIAVLIGFVALGGAQTAPQPTVTSAPAIAMEPSPAAPTETATPAPTLDILAVADATRTAQANLIETARVLFNATQVAETQAAFDATNTLLALTPTVEATLEAASTETPTEAPTNTPGPTRTPRPTFTPGPSPTPRPTNTPGPTTAPTVQQAEGAMLGVGSGGELFQGSARIGSIPPDQGNGGSCIQGRVTNADGSLFQNFYVQVDNRGSTKPANHFYDSGNYRICGLAAGEWGVAVYAVNNKPTSGAEQGGHQVRLRLSGVAGEIFFVDFRAKQLIAIPTEVPSPTPEPPTPTPEPSPYDGDWAGQIGGTTAGGGSFTGRFRMSVRNGAIYSIAIDGPSCPFETYPNFPNGRPISGNSFSLTGSPFNPQVGADASIQFNISGTFASTSNASGVLNATQNGGACADATWSISKR